MGWSALTWTVLFFFTYHTQARLQSEDKDGCVISVTLLQEDGHSGWTDIEEVLPEKDCMRMKSSIG
jgi:hypothetical protein